MIASAQPGVGRARHDDVRCRVEARTALVFWDPDPFGPTTDVARSIDDAVRRLTGEGELVDVALAPLSSSVCGDTPATTSVVVTAVVRTAPLSAANRTAPVSAANRTAP